MDKKNPSATTGLQPGRFDLRWISFGSPAAIVTSMALIVGLDAATARKGAVVASLLIIGIADNLSDSLSVHIYQESESMARRQAFRTTIANYAARFAVSASFLVLFLALPMGVAGYVCLAWGFLLLSALSYLLARARRLPVLSEILKHTGVAMIVILISNSIGLAIRSLVLTP